MARVYHHATLCIAAYGFLISERETISPSGYRPTVGELAGDITNLAGKI
jgi:hypothetical protein